MGHIMLQKTRTVVLIEQRYMRIVVKVQSMVATIPEPKPNRGRKPTKLKAQTDPIRVDEWAARQPEDAWQMIPIRETTRGTLYAHILQERVWVWEGGGEEAHCWHLIIRREIDLPKEIKYSLSNASEEKSIERLAFMQGQRFWVERASSRTEIANAVSMNTRFAVGMAGITI